MLQKLNYKNPLSDFNINIEGLNERFEQVCIFESNPKANTNKNLQYSQLIAIGARAELIIKNQENALEQLQTFYDARKGWLFGFLSYDLKNEIEELSSENSDQLEFPLIHFFSPEVVIQVKEKNISVFYDDDFITITEAEEIYNFSIKRYHKEVLNNSISSKATFRKTNIQSKITRLEYISSVNQLKQHIRKGDIYEINFCQEFYSEKAEINTVETFKKLNAISQAPFAAYCKLANHYIMCTSPERFLQKRGNTLISQPIKGTCKRSEDKTEDEYLIHQLKNNSKERAENVMIVDLVRNDLSRVAKRGSVHVDELCGVYSFKQVHQLISTVSCELKEHVSFTDIIKSTFPMGSMTGAPKVSAMKLIEQTESTKRGLYSGTIGYIAPNGDFDFNVVIRSILYNAKNKYLSFMVGSAITDKADAEEEYDECLLKAKAMFEVLGE